MDNNIEWLGNNRVDNTAIDGSIPNEQANNTETPTAEIPIKPSIWTLQEILHFGYHPRKVLKTEDLEVIFKEDRKYLVWIVLCAVLYFADIFFDVFIALHFFSYNRVPTYIIGSIILLIVVVPSLISNINNASAIWRTKEYQTWCPWKRYIWWIFFPFYFLFNLEPLFQYYKNFLNLKNYLSHLSGTRTVPEEGLIEHNEPDHILEDYSEGVFIVAKLRWLQATLQAVPILALYMYFLYTYELRRIIGVLVISCVTSVIGVWLSNYKFTKAYFITRGRKISNIFIFSYSLCSSLITIFRIMLIEDIFLYSTILFVTGFRDNTEGWAKPIILTILVVGHWIYETVRWKLQGPEGFTGFMYTFYAGIYRTSVPDVSSLARCIETNAIMMIETSFFYISGQFMTTNKRFNDIVNYLLLFDHYLVGILFFAHVTHICLYYHYKKKISVS